MRSSSKIFAITLASLAICACEERFELKGSAGEPRMFVECYAGLSDTTFLSIYKAVSVNAPVSDASDYTVRSMSLTVDGVPVALDTIGHYMRTYTTAPIAPGSRLEFSLETEETAPVSASTTVPDKPAFTVEQRVIDTPGSFIRFRQFNLTFEGGLKKGEYYGISIVHHDVYNHPDSLDAWDTYFNEAPITLGATPDASAQTGRTVQFRLSAADEPVSMAIFSADDFPYGTVSASIIDDFFIPDFDPGAFEGYEDPGEEDDSDGDEPSDEIPSDDDETVVTHHYQILVFKLSEETYGYFGALNNQQSNFLAMLGLSAPNYAYTNIAGGYGIFGGISRSESPWLTPDE